jgi:hypothetical protein
MITDQVANKPHLAYQVENKCFNTPIVDWKTFSFLFLFKKEFPSEDDRKVETAGQ